MDFSGIFIWGFLASVVMVLVESAGLWFGWSRLSTPIILGSVVCADRDRAALLGAAVHLCVGWVFAGAYAIVFWKAGHATWWGGGLLGVVHALFFLGILLPTISAVHPRMADTRAGPEPSRALQAPGFLGLQYGRGTLVVSLVAHAVFGTTFGWLYTI